MVIDTHTHAWGPSSPTHPWVPGGREMVADFSVDQVYTAEKLLADMDATGIDEAVVVGYPICEWTDNWYAVECAENHDRLYGVVTIDPFAADAADVLREHLAVDGVIGFRLGAICPIDRMWRTFDPTATWLADVIEEREFFEAARETDALVHVLAHVDQLDQTRTLVETYPDLTYVFDHFGLADPEVPPGEGPFSAFADFADDDVYVKLSEIAHRSAAGYPYRDVHDHVRWFLDVFGRERVAWGSDFPNVSDVATYEETLAWLDHVDGLSRGDRKWLTERTFPRLLD